jgi:hypothetical protein
MSNEWVAPEDEEDIEDELVVLSTVACALRLPMTPASSTVFVFEQGHNPVLHRCLTFHAQDTEQEARKEPLSPSPAMCA